MSHSSRPAKWELASLALILLVAGLLRLGAPGLTEFKLDEARLSLLALDMARGESFPLLGIGSSVGIPNMPVSVWLFALPYLISSDPTVATLFVGLLNVLAVLLTWWLARRYFGPAAALTAALLYAVSPWAVIYSRKIWAQDLLPPFVLLTVGTGLIGWLETPRPGRWRWQVAHLILLVLTVQIHYAALTLIPLTLGMIGLGWRDLPGRTRRWLGAIALLGLLSLGAGVLLMTGRGINLGVFGRNGLGLTADALYHFSLVVTGNEIHSLAGPQAFLAFLATVPDLTPIQSLFGLLIVGAALLAAGQAWRGQPGLPRRVRLALVAWLVLPLIIFSITWTPTYPHYLIPLMPAAFILFGVAASEVLARLGRVWPRQARLIAALGIAALVVFAGLQVWNTVALHAFVDSHATPGGFGTPLHDLLDVRRAVLAQSPRGVLVAGLDSNVYVDQDAAVWELLLYDVPVVRPLDGRQQAILSGDPAGIVLLETPALHASGLALAEASCGEAGQRFDLRPGEGAYRVCAPPAADTPDAAPLAVFDTGARLLGLALEPAGAADAGPVVRMRWAADGPLPADVTVFCHVLDAAGERLGQVDSPAWPGRFWAGGEVQLQVLALPDSVPLEGAATLRLGLYRFENGLPVNANVLDSAGNPAGQWVDVPLSKD